MIVLILCALAFVISLALVPWYAYKTVHRQPVSPVGPLAAWSALTIFNGVMLAQLLGVL